MIIGIEGGMGSGKTIQMVRYLLKDYNIGFKILANFGLKEIEYDKLDVEKLMTDVNLNNISVGIDEITVFLDCRKSSSRMNRYLSYFILQTRKRNVNLYFTTQSFSMIDKRLLDHTDIQIICDKIFDDDGNEIDHVRQYYLYDLRNLRNITSTEFMMNIAKYYDFYDTNERILPPISN